MTFNNGGNSVYNTLQEDVAGGTLTIGPGVTIAGGSGAIGYDPSIGGPSNVAFANQGTIDADSAGTISLNGTAWSNSGTIESSGGGSLNLYGAGWSNSATVTASGGTLNLGNAAWSNAGTISANSVTTNLGGTFTQADLGSFSRTGGAVNLTGTLTNAGATLALTAATGSWNLAGGTIDGGTVTASGGALLEATNQGGRLEDGVTLLGDPSMTDAVVLDMATSNPVVTVAGGALTLSNTTISLEATSYAVLQFTDAQASLAGTGTVTFNNGSNSVYNTIQEDVAGGTLTIGPGVTIAGGSGAIGYDPSIGGPSSVSFVNRGTIDADSAGTISLNGTAWSNSGTMEVSGGGSLALNGSGWTNSGTVTVGGGTLNLGGSFSQAAIGSFSRTGGTVNLTGTLTNTGTTLALTATTGSWNLAGGTVNGGTVTASGGALLEATNQGGQLKDGVTLMGDPSKTDAVVLDMATSNPVVTVAGGALTLSNATIPFEATSYAILQFTDAQASLAGTGTVTFNNGGNSVYNTLQEGVAGGTLTIGPGVTIGGGSGAIGYDPSIGGPANVAFVNRGTIDADSAGTITLNGTGWTNDGTIESSGGGNLNFYGSGWTNSGTVTFSGNTLNLGGSFSQAAIGSFSRTGGTVNLTGTLTNTGTTLALTAATGSWNLAGGTVNGGTVTATGGALLEATNQGGRLEDGVTLLGDPSTTDAVVLDMATSNPIVTVAGGALTLSNATIPFEATSYAILQFTDAQASLAGTGTVTFNNGGNSVYNTLQEGVAGGTLTIGPGVTIAGGSGAIGYDPSIGGPANVAFVNRGTIDADSAGTITLNGTGWTNDGTIESSGGGNLNFYGSGWTNSGTVTFSGNTLNLGGSFSQAAIGSFSRTGGTVNLTGTLTNTGTTLALTAATGSWNLAGGTVAGGTVTAAGGALLEATNQGGRLEDGVTLLGDPSTTDAVVLDLATSNPIVTVAGGALTLSNATLPLEATSYAILQFTDAQASLDGTGTVTFNNGGNSVYNTIQEDVAGGTLTIGPGVTINGGSGGIGYDGSIGGPASVSFVNRGTIDAGSAGTITLNGAAWTNNGTIEASGGGTVSATLAPTNFSAGTLTGGTWDVTSPGTLRVPFGASFTTNAASILLDGASAHFYSGSATTPALGGLTTNAAAGSLTIQGGANLITPAAFTNSGQLTIGNGSTLGFMGSGTSVVPFDGPGEPGQPLARRRRRDGQPGQQSRHAQEWSGLCPGTDRPGLQPPERRLRGRRDFDQPGPRDDHGRLLDRRTLVELELHAPGRPVGQFLVVARLVDLRLRAQPVHVHHDAERIGLAVDGRYVGAHLAERLALRRGDL